MSEYIPRIIDSRLDAALKESVSVRLVGMKGVGKTRTALEKAGSSFPFGRRRGRQKTPNPTSVLSGKSPVLIDECPAVPGVQDTKEDGIKATGETVRYILTSSMCSPVSSINGCPVIRMSTMSLYETGDSSGEVSVSSLFENAPVHGNLRNITLAEIMHYIVRGGWPDNLNASDSSRMPRYYIERFLRRDLEEKNGYIDRKKFRRIMRVLAENTGTVCSVGKLRRDTKSRSNPAGIDEDTISGYLDVLSDFQLIYEEEVFCPDFRTTQRFKTGVKRHFEDTSLACAVIGADEKNLVDDLELLEHMFESLVTHDLRIYMESLGGYVSHYRSYPNDEVDAVLTLDDGRFGFVEIKLGWEDVIDRAAANLLRISSKLEEKPSFLAVVSGMSSIPYRRADGVYVIPLTSLRP